MVIYTGDLKASYFKCHGDVTRMLIVLVKFTEATQVISILNF